MMVTTTESVPAVRLEAVTRIYGGAGESSNAVIALDDLTVDVPAGAFTAVMGPSGSGKSTFLHCAAGLDQPTRGRVLIDGVELAGRSETALTKFRRQLIGFVFQQYNLLETLTVRQNVMLPLRLAGRPVDRKRCDAVLARIGLGDRLDHRPGELSGGQQQRVAIARALVTDPRVIFADEPTGALDSAGGAAVLALLREAVDEFEQTVVMVTHDPIAAAYADEAVFLRDGRLVGRLTKPTVETVTDRMTAFGAGVANRCEQVAS
jgi:putative ABC transport system ATP-binding protein